MSQPLFIAQVNMRHEYCIEQSLQANKILQQINYILTIIFLHDAKKKKFISWNINWVKYHSLNTFIKQTQQKTQQNKKNNLKSNHPYCTVDNNF